MFSPVGALAGSSSFDVPPAEKLDPVLFDGEKMRPTARLAILRTLLSYLDAQYLGSSVWLRVWLAGSGASYRWYAAPGLKDLDVLLGVDFIRFRQSNPAYVRMGNSEIAHMMNERMRSELWPATKDWQGRYEVTFYVNPGSWDIRSIKPYAAYDLMSDSWTVPATKNAPQVPAEYQQYAASVQGTANRALERYSSAWTDLQNATSPVHRVNAERRFNMAVDHAIGIFDTVHEGRRTAFSPTGQGYDDPANFLWQSGKKAGWIQALRQIKDYHQQAQEEGQVQTYGITLPDTDTLIRRAMTYKGVA